MHCPRIMIAAAASGSGKTSVACALMEAFRLKGTEVRACKCGPDYIDPMFHREVIGVASRNLDLFFSDKEEIRSEFVRYSSDADLTVTEGVMGYYDGRSLDTVEGSSYDIARTLEMPVLLVLPARGASLSLAAVIRGMKEFRKDSNIRGILLNRISGMLYPRLKAALEAELEKSGIRIPIVGYVPEDDSFRLESRHLGLVTPQELENLKEQIRRGAGILQKSADLEKIYSIAQSAPDLPGDQMERSPDSCEKKVRIAVARDEAFCFYYQANLEFLESLGAELVPFSPLHDRRLPENISGLLLGGGYPELYGAELADNERMRREIRRCLSEGLPCLAECGGFMYLHEELEDREGNVFPMAGVIRGRTAPAGKLVRFGYVDIENSGREGFEDENSGAYLLPGEKIKGHEFHYWDSTQNGEDCVARKPDGRRSWPCIHMRGNLFAGYPHLYLPSLPRFACRFMERCRKFQRKKEAEEV